MMASDFYSTLIIYAASLNSTATFQDIDDYEPTFCNFTQTVTNRVKESPKEQEKAAFEVPSTRVIRVPFFLLNKQTRVFKNNWAARALRRQ